MALKFYNTLTRKKETFTPMREGRVGLYTCGPTVYNYAHIGNLRTYIFEDILRRVLEYTGFRVTHVMNITDVGHLTSDADTGEDKMEKGAKREKKTVWDIAAFYTDAFKKDMTALHIKEPTIWCKATDHIAEQIALIERLKKNGYTYSIADGVYFDTSKFLSYGALARLNLKGQKAGARVEIVKGKKNPTDFALWKLSVPKDGHPELGEGSPKKQRQMEWESPWGKGFPGWHIECSAMAMKYLGEEFDIHTGGIDHIPVHHTNEIAQAEAATGHPFVHYWLHGEYLVINDAEKMAKSGESFTTIATLVEKHHDPLAYRYLTLTTHYRKQLAFSWEALESAEQGLKNLRERLYESGDTIGELPDTVKKKFEAAISDDLNMPKALAYLWEIVKSKKSGAIKRAAAKEFDAIFALDLLAHKTELVPEHVMILVREREKAREHHEWQKSDDLRKRILEEGWLVEDTPQGSHVKKKLTPSP
ncbi:cysteine--tRNA ligase [Candidatus Uhrbacteria bacterium]|nr:cysteine--tRNA ligase [Candidatus Uhrbacteria bacterium]